MLERACVADPACGCAELGAVLLAAEDDTGAGRGVGLLLGACQAGAKAACDSLRVVAELCRRGAHADASRACSELVQHKLLTPAPPLELARLLGCWSVSGQSYTHVCFQPRRAFMRLASGAWDAFPVEWQRVSRTLLTSRLPEPGSALGVGSMLGTHGPELRLQVADPPVRLELIDGFPLQQTDAAEQRRLLAAIAALPDPHDACARARRCVAAANEQLKAPPDAAPEQAPLVSAIAISSGDRLFDCTAARAQAITFLEASQRAVPEPCR